MSAAASCRAAVVALTLASSGCSWIFVTPPRTPVGGGRPPACSESKVAPVLDTAAAVPSVLTALSGLLLIAIADEFDRTVGGDDTTALGASLLIGGAVLAIVTIASANYGYTRTDRCREQRLAPIPESGSDGAPATNDPG